MGKHGNLTFADKFWAGFILALPALVGALILFAVLSSAIDSYRFNHLSAAEHLSEAESRVRTKQ